MIIYLIDYVLMMWLLYERAQLNMYMDLKNI